MVQSPWREDVKWENTGLRAGEAETDTRQRKSGRLDAKKPISSHVLCLHVLPNSTLEFLVRLPGGEGMTPFLERILHVQLKLLLTLTGASSFTLTIFFVSIFVSLCIYLCACMLSLFNCV